MNIEWQQRPSSQWQADALLFFAFEKAAGPLPGLQRWMAAEGSWLSRLPSLTDFKGKSQHTAVIYAPEGEAVPRVIVAGLGPLDKFDADKLRVASAAALRKCRELGISRPALPLIALEGLPLDSLTALQEALIGGQTGLYRFDVLKTRDVEPATAPETLLLLTEEAPSPALSEVPVIAGAIASGITLARDLVVSPANRVTPTFIAREARHLAERHGLLIEVFDLEMAQTMGMGAFAAVAQGSREPACFVVLEYNPPKQEEAHPLVFVGKGITFDTGGISLKPSANMEAMKQDMAGAAAVLGAMDALATLKVPRRIVGLLPCTENMPDGKSYKPGDVVRSLAGLSIEVISTDAEGRMILCDALTYALRFQPALVVDIATLTGACIVALGNRAGAVLSNRDHLAGVIRDWGREVGERFWPLPLWDFYFENIKSDVADFKNVGDRSAGTIVGGIFLKQFMPAEVPWAHLDIAGPAWTDKDLFTAPKGATGFGVRVLTELARRWSEIEESVKRDA